MSIVLESTAGDTYLYLREGDARSGTFLQENDDDGGITRSRIEETLAAGSYTIEVTTYDAGVTGSFTLTVSGLGATAGPGPDPSADPCAESLSGDGTTSGEWAEGCESTAQTGSHARYYSFSLAESSEVSIVLESTAGDTYLYLREGDARSGTFLQENDDDGGITRSRIEETLAAGSYTIEVTTYDAGVTGSFTLTVSGLGATAGPGPDPSADPCAESLSGDGTTSGEWAEGCESTAQTGSHARYYSFSLAESSEVSIVLESTAGDTYLYLREGDARSGTFLQENDDDGGITRSRIEETLAAGSYTIEVTTYDAGVTGSFTLTVSGLGATAGPGPDPSADPCAESLSGDGTTSGEWAEGCESTAQTGSHARYYSFSLAESSEVSIVLESTAGDTYLYLREGDARSGTFLQENDDDGGITRSRIEETLAAGSYTIEVTTYDAGVTGSFTLTVSGLGATAGPGPDPSADPCAESLSGDGTTSGEWAEGCESTAQTGSHARYYSFSLAESSEVSIVLESTAGDTYLYLREGDARSGTFLQENDDDGGITRSRIEETLAAGSYTIEVTTYDAGVTGSFTLTVSGLGATAGPGPDPSADPCAESLSGDGTTSGEWAEGCESTAQTGSHARYYSFSLAESSEVSIVLESTAGDTYLYLREGDARSGTFLQENDDDGGITRSRIEETLAAGSYTIEVTTYDAGVTGSFTLTVSGLGATAGPGPDPSADPCAESLSGDGTTSGEWAEGCESTAQTGSHARYYSFSLAESSEVSIVLESTAGDTYLYLREGDARSGTFLQENDDDGGITRSRIEETLAAGSYTIEVTTYDAGVTGSFTLTVSGLGATAGPGPDPSADPCAESLSGDGTTSGEWAEGCESTAQTGSHARYYSFSLAESSEVSIVLESTAGDTYLYLREGDARSGTFLHENDDDGGITRSRIEETLAAGSYTIEVTTYDAGVTGSFTLTVSGLGDGTTTEPPTGETVSEREALTSLYNATDGANWANSSGWLTNATLGEWYGVDTNSDGSVTVLILLENGLNGTIPAELASLRNLEQLSLDDNRLTGPIPPELGNLTNLKRLTANNILVNNEAVGGLTGGLPLDLTDLTNLTQLALAGHDLSGELPSELGNLTNLEELFLWRNEFTGSIPSSLENLTNLTDLYLQGNQFTGCIPAGLEDIEDNDLHLLDLPYCGSDQGSGTGDVAGDRAALEALYNAADGANWDNSSGWLTNAPLDQWYGVTTDDDGRVVEVDLERNRLSGPIPAAVGNLYNLEELRLGYNLFTGTLPSELGNLTRLTYLGITHSEIEGGLTGGIPPELGNLIELTTLALGGHDLSGGLPSELSNLTKLEQLILWYNQFSGAIPNWLGDLTQLYRLGLWENQFSGPIPSELGNLYNLGLLRLGGNLLSGPIPSELGNLSEMEKLQLNDNQLTGSIPTELENLTLLETLYLGGNQFTGCIPAALFNVLDNDLNRLYDLSACSS